ncbi:MAG: hypothetical protein IJ626_03680 [Muribaculaceae bacterium]|nr:hypothetical protein [Muribaculaceae bacterium]
MSIAIYTITSPLHDKEAVAASTKEFLGTIKPEFTFCDTDYTGYGQSDLDLIYVRTGGTEGVFKRLLPQLQAQSQRPIRLLTSGKSNSLAASMEILSYLGQNGISGEIIHGDENYVNHRIELLARAGEARRYLSGARLGIVGEPSDWLISSAPEPEAVRERLGVELVRIPMDELLAEYEAAAEVEADPALLAKTQNAVLKQSLTGAERIYVALKRIVAKHGLKGLTIRCFDLLTAVKNTGCIALAKLNSEGIVAGCEGDVPAMLSMAVTRATLGISGFQANPSQINPVTGEMLFAHCTIPLNMVNLYELDTHYESGIGVGIRGYMQEGPVTIFKVSADLSRSFIAEGELLRSQAKPDLCRTQQVIKLADATQTGYFLTNPIGNHHIIMPGHNAELLKEVIR